MPQRLDSYKWCEICAFRCTNNDRCNVTPCSRCPNETSNGCWCTKDRSPEETDDLCPRFSPILRYYNSDKFTSDGRIDCGWTTKDATL